MREEKVEGASAIVEVEKTKLQKKNPSTHGRHLDPRRVVRVKVHDRGHSPALRGAGWMWELFFMEEEEEEEVREKPMRAVFDRCLLPSLHGKRKQSSFRSSLINLDAQWMRVWCDGDAGRFDGQ